MTARQPSWRERLKSMRTPAGRAFAWAAYELHVALFELYDAARSKGVGGRTPLPLSTGRAFAAATASVWLERETPDPATAEWWRRHWSPAPPPVPASPPAEQTGRPFPCRFPTRVRCPASTSERCDGVRHQLHAAGAWTDAPCPRQPIPLYADALGWLAEWVDDATAVVLYDADGEPTAEFPASFFEPVADPSGWLAAYCTGRRDGRSDDLPTPAVEALQRPAFDVGYRAGYEAARGAAERGEPWSDDPGDAWDCFDVLPGSQDAGPTPSPAGAGLPPQSPSGPLGRHPLDRPDPEGLARSRDAEPCGCGAARPADDLEDEPGTVTGRILGPDERRGLGLPVAEPAGAARVPEVLRRIGTQLVAEQPGALAAWATAAALCAAADWVEALPEMRRGLGLLACLVDRLEADVRRRAVLHPGALTVEGHDAAQLVTRLRALASR